MSISSGPKVINDDSLILNLDAANFKNTDSTTITNIINPFTVNYSAYNNPGFVTTVTRTNELFKGVPVHRITFSPQDAARIPRLGSTEGFGHFHGMQTSLFPNTPYIASVYFKTNYPVNTSTFSNTYSNIGGWGHSSTGTTRFTEGGWTRFYTRFLNNITIGGVNYCTRDSYGAGVINVNTTEQTDITLTIIFNANRTVTITGPLNSSTIGLSDASTMIGIRSLSPNIDSTTVTGLSTGGSAIINHGLNTSTWTKITNENPIYHANFPITYYAVVRVPSTSGIQRTINFRPTIFAFNSSISDQKFWKITFNTSALAVNDVIETFWVAPMLEQTNRLYPSPYVIGTESKNFFINTTWPDLSGNNNITLVNGPLYSGDRAGSFLFDGIDDHGIGSISSSTFTGPHTISAWINRRTMKQWSGIFSNNVNTSSCSILTFIDQTSRIGANQAGVSANEISIDLGADYLNKWIYITIVYTGVTSGSPVNVYGFKDGNLISSTGNLYWNLSTSSQYYIGRHWTSGTQVHDGFISKVSIYNRALTLDEVRQNFEATRGRYLV
jgi:hypothetical protein